MKSLDQIYRYTKDCSFSQDEWERVLMFCKDQFRGGRIHKATKPICESTYDQFIEWYNDGFGSGDMVGYGNTVGIVGNDTPEGAYLVAYCDYEGNLIVKRMDIMDRERLRRLGEEESVGLKKLMISHKLDYDVRAAQVFEMYSPEKFSYVTLDFSKNKRGIGMYLESDGYTHKFLSYLIGNSFSLDQCVEAECTPLRPAKDSDIKSLQDAAKKSGWVLNRRVMQYSKVRTKKRDNHYWYLNEKFQLLSDVDNGSQKHTARYDAGNYFLDGDMALEFARKVVELAKETNGRTE